MVGEQFVLMIEYISSIGVTYLSQLKQFSMSESKQAVSEPIIVDSDEKVDREQLADGKSSEQLGKSTRSIEIRISSF